MGRCARPKGRILDVRKCDTAVYKKEHTLYIKGQELHENTGMKVLLITEYKNTIHFQYVADEEEDARDVMRRYIDKMTEQVKMDSSEKQSKSEEKAESFRKRCCAEERKIQKSKQKPSSATYKKTQTSLMMGESVQKAVLESESVQNAVLEGESVQKAVLESENAKKEESVGTIVKNEVEQGDEEGKSSAGLVGYASVVLEGIKKVKRKAKRRPTIRKRKTPGDEEPKIAVNISPSTTDPVQVSSPAKKRQRLHFKEEPDSTAATSEKAAISALHRNRTHITEIRSTKAISAVLAVKYVAQVADAYRSIVQNHQNSHCTPNAQYIPNVDSVENMESRKLAEKEENEEQETIQWLLEMSRATL